MTIYMRHQLHTFFVTNNLNQLIIKNRSQSFANPNQAHGLKTKPALDAYMCLVFEYVCKVRLGGETTRKKELQLLKNIYYSQSL